MNNITLLLATELGVRPQQVQSAVDLLDGRLLEGTVSNVAQFGAFVDLGVHQDGLVHVSQMSHKFVNDAREVEKTGAVLKVRVLEGDLVRKRVALTMKLDAPTPKPMPKPGQGGDKRFRAALPQRAAAAAAPQAALGAMAVAFAKLPSR